MNDFNPYITFDGSCEDALAFYQGCFGGKIEFIQYYEDSVQHLGAKKSKVMHSEFRSDVIHFMACDKSPGQNIHQGTNISLYISFGQMREQDDVFEKLSRDGIVHMALEATFWGSRLGIVTDKFGIHWMLVLNSD
jgi:PhnB protein